MLFHRFELSIKILQFPVQLSDAPLVVRILGAKLSVALVQDVELLDFLEVFFVLRRGGSRLRSTLAFLNDKNVNTLKPTLGSKHIPSITERDSRPMSE